MAEAKKFVEEDEDFLLLKTLAETESFTGEDKANVLFAYAKALEDLKQNKKSFSVYLQANQAHRATYSYDIEETAAEFEEIRNTISPDFFKAHKNSGVQDNRPIFVLGMPRSGTSLVEQILASHRAVYGAGELYNLEKTYFYLIRQKGERSFSEAFANASEEFLKELGSDYIQQLNKLGSKASFIIDKMPRNFIYTGLIKLILPNAKIIHCKRTPEDTCLSIYKKFFVGDQKFAYDLEELGRFYNLYLNHMEYWKSLLGDDLYEVTYEEMIADQESETRKLLDYCELDWDDNCLQFYKTKRAVRTASTDQVRQPIYKSSVEAWRTYEEELQPLTAILNQSR
nr:sulfotransferase [Sneathiella limimaris]